MIYFGPNIKYRIFIYLIFFCFISYFDIFLIKSISNHFTIDLYKILILSLTHGVIALISLHFFFYEITNHKIKDFIKQKINILKYKKKKIIYHILSLLIIFCGSTIYLEFIDRNNLNSLFYEISMVVEFRKPFNILMNFKNYFAGILFTISVYAFFYFLYYFRINKYLSILGAIIFASSQTHLYNLYVSPFRDYIKAPIIILLLYFFLKIIFFEKSTEKNFKVNILIITTLLYFGFFVRSDLLLFHLFFLGIFSYIFLKNFYLKKMKNIIFLKCLLFYLIINICHFSTLFLFQTDNLQITATFISTVNDTLNISNPNYDIGHIFRDEYMRNLNTFNENYAVKSIFLFPADFLIKIVASIQNILTFGFKNGLPPPGLEQDYIKKIYEVRFLFLNIFQDIIIYIFIFSIFILTLKKNLDGWVILGLILSILIYPLIQHAIKHYFYLEIIALWSITYSTQFLLDIKKNVQKNNL